MGRPLAGPRMQGIGYMYDSAPSWYRLRFKRPKGTEKEIGTGHRSLGVIVGSEPVIGFQYSQVRGTLETTLPLSLQTIVEILRILGHSSLDIPPCIHRLPIEFTVGMSPDLLVGDPSCPKVVFQNVVFAGVPRGSNPYLHGANGRLSI